MDSNFAQPSAPHAGQGVLWGVLRRHRWLILACALVGGTVGALLARRMAPMYEASVLVLLQRETPAVATLSAPQPAPLRENRIATDLEVLQSRALAEAVVDSLQLRLRVAEPAGVRRGEIFSQLRIAPLAEEAAYRFVRDDASGRFRVLDAATGRHVATAAPGMRVRLPEGEVTLARSASRHEEIAVEVVGRSAAAADLAASLEVGQPSRDADAVRIRYRGTDPELVRDVPNALAAGFIALRRELQTGEARSTAAFLRGQLDTLRGQLSAAEDRLRAFREREGVVDLGVETSAQVGRLAQMEAERGAVASEQRALGSMLAQARAAGPGPGGESPYRRLMAFPTLLRNEAATEMLAALARVEDERTALLSRRKADDPEVQVLTHRIDELEGQLQSIVTTYQQGLSSQVASMDATLGGFKGRLDRVPGKELEHARLARQARALEEMYGHLQTRLKEAEIAEAVQDPSVRLVDAAALPTEPLGVRKGLLVGGTGFFGLLLGLALGFVREYRDGTVRSREDLEAGTALPVLGWIPRIEGLGQGERAVGALQSVRRLVSGGGRRRALVAAPGGAVFRLPLVGGEAQHDPAAGAFEWLHRNVLFARPDQEIRTLVFTSPLPGDGKTTAASGLAVTLARRGLKVLLVDADLRRGTLNALAPGKRQAGFADLLAGAATFQQAVRTADVGGGNVLHYLPTGALPPDATRLLDSPRAAALMEWLREKYYLIVFDAPPVNLFADAAVLGGRADAVVLVARAGLTEFDALTHAAEQCRRAGLPLLGTVLNDVDPRRDRDYDAAYGWYGQARQYYARAG